MSPYEWSHHGLRTYGVQQFIRCTLPCCRFEALDSSRGTAVEHTLRARVAETTAHRQTPRSIALERLLSEYQTKRSTLNTCNSVLLAADEKPLSTRHVDQQSAALAHRMVRSPAA